MGHDPQQKRVHYFGACANALGGHIDRPIAQIVPVQAPLALPAVGGYASAQAESFRLGSILSFQAAHTHVAGSTTQSGSYSTMVTSVIEGLNVLNVVTAERLVAQISLEHPAVGYIPRVTFLGTQFVNVKIGGQELKIDVNLDICKQGDGKAFPELPLTRDEKFLARVAAQRQSITGEASTPQWAKDRYQWNGPNASPSIICSVVAGLSGTGQARFFGNAFEVFDFGKGFFGELLVDGNSFRLIMLRLELGCGIKGAVVAGDAVGQGSTDP